MPAPVRPLITLTTDFGNNDGYVAAMKGTILSIAPRRQAHRHHTRDQSL